MKFKFQLVVVCFICLFSTTCFSTDIQNLTNQNDIYGIYMWHNEVEFYYFSNAREWYVYNIESKKYRKVPYPKTDWVFCNADINNSTIEASFLNDGETLVIQDKKAKSNKNVQLNMDFDPESTSIPPNGKYVGLYLLALREDAGKWTMLDVKSLDLITIPMNQNEYNGGSTAWSNDSKYVAFSMIRIKGVDRAEADTSDCGLLVFDIENRKVIYKYLRPIPNCSYDIIGFKYPDILFLNEKWQLCLCNIKTNKISIVYEGKLDNALWGPNKEIYTVLNGKLVKILY